MDTFTAGTNVVFTSLDAGHVKYEGLATVVRPLEGGNPSDHYDPEEVGPMYRVRSFEGAEFDAFHDELKRCW